MVELENVYDTNSEAYGILVVVEGAVAIIVARYDT